MTKKNIFCTFLFLLSCFLFAKDIVHIIEKGDTLYGLSKRYKVSVSVLLKKNNISDASKIKAGQKIIIPQKDTTLSSNIKTINYKVKRGDSLFALAKKFGITFNTLLKLNGFTSKTMLKIGQVIKIPQQKTATSTKKTSIAKKTTPKKTTQKTTTTKSKDSLKSISAKEADSTLLWPVPAKKVFYLSGKISGVVIDSTKGQSVDAIASGKVVSIGPHRGFGQVVFIQTKTKHIFVYGGLTKVIVKKGDTIRFGKKIGELGPGLFTGKSRLYFMVYNKNKPIDPALAPRGF